MKKSAGPAYGGSFVASLLFCLHLGLILTDYGQKTSTRVMLGSRMARFLATVQFTGALFAKQSMKLFAIKHGYQLVCYLVMGVMPDALMAKSLWLCFANSAPVKLHGGHESEPYVEPNITRVEVFCP